jgi:hypothetical protein
MEILYPQGRTAPIVSTDHGADLGRAQVLFGDSFCNFEKTGMEECRSKFSKVGIGHLQLPSRVFASAGGVQAASPEIVGWSRWERHMENQINLSGVVNRVRIRSNDNSPGIEEVERRTCRYWITFIRR